MIAGSNDKSVIIWDLTGNLTLDSEIGHGSRPIQYSGNDETVSEHIKNIFFILI